MPQIHGGKDGRLTFAPTEISLSMRTPAMLHLLYEFGKSRTIEAHARQLAKSSVDGVRQRVESRFSSMTASETRGFIRALASRVVRRQTRIRLAGRQNLPSDWHATIIRKATDHLVPLVMHELWKTTPAPSGERSAA